MSDLDDLWYARFIRDSGCVRKDGSVHPNAFLDKRPPHNTSVSWHEKFAEDIHWDVGATIDPSRPLKGAADIAGQGIRSVGMDVVKTERVGDPPFHAEIRGWNMSDSEEGKMMRKAKARELAGKSVFVVQPK